MRGSSFIATLLAAVAAAHSLPEQLPLFLQSAAEISSKDGLDQWLSDQEMQIKAKVPVERQRFALDSVNKEFQQRLAELDMPEPPARASQLPAFLFLRSARNCTSVEDLNMWREQQLEQIKQNVPLHYQSFGLKSIEQEYAKHAARIQQNEVTLASASQEVLPVLSLSAEEYDNAADVKTWHAEQLKQIETVVPKDYRGFARDTVDKELQMRLVALGEAPADNEALELIAHAKGRIAGGGLHAGTAVMIASSLVLPGFFLVAAAAAALRRSAAGVTSEPLLGSDEA